MKSKDRADGLRHGSAHAHHDRQKSGYGPEEVAALAAELWRVGGKAGGSPEEMFRRAEEILRSAVRV